MHYKVLGGAFSELRKCERGNG